VIATNALLLSRPSSPLFAVPQIEGTNPYTNGGTVRRNHQSTPE